MTGVAVEKYNIRYFCLKSGRSMNDPHIFLILNMLMMILKVTATYFFPLIYFYFLGFLENCTMEDMDNALSYLARARDGR